MRAWLRETKWGKPVAATGVAAALTGVGLAYQAKQNAPPPLKPVPSVLVATPTPEPAPTPEPVKEIVVHVTGAVKKPGVYHFQSGMRLYQAVEKAGGFTQDADKEALNLADLLQDADQLNIPTRAQVKQNVAPITVLAPQTARATKTAPATPGKGRVLGKTTPPIVTALAPKETRSASPPAAEEPEKPDTKLRKPGDGVVHLNSATAEDLQRLPGVGEVMAEKILAYRQEIGKFTAIEQLKEVDKIGDKKFAAMEPFLRL